MVGRFNVAFVGVVSIGISALPYCYYESLCNHLRDGVARAVTRLLRRTLQLGQSIADCRLSRSSRCLLVRNSSADGTIKLAVEIGRYQFWRPAAGTQTESQFAAKRCFGHPQIVFGFAKKFSQTSRRISRGREHCSRGANFFRNHCD
jgi:hypothetical protein